MLRRSSGNGRFKSELCGVELKNPITTASGTFGFGHEYGEFFDLSQLGGIGVKGLTPTERLGNPAPRIAETPQGILNCVGLQNPGIDRFIEEQIPFLRRYDTKIIAKRLRQHGRGVRGHG